MRAATLHQNAAYRDPAHPQGESPCAACVSAAAAYPPAPVMQIEVVDGLEFEVPTWDPAPTPWFAAGSWASDPALTARVLTAIRAAVPDHEALVRQAIEAARRVEPGPYCGTYWGSHGCSLPSGHEARLHVCGLAPGDLCSAILPWGEDSTAILWWADDAGGLRLSSHHWTWFR